MPRYDQHHPTPAPLRSPDLPIERLRLPVDLRPHDVLPLDAVELAAEVLHGVTGREVAEDHVRLSTSARALMPGRTRPCTAAGGTSSWNCRWQGGARATGALPGVGRETRAGPSAASGYGRVAPELVLTINRLAESGGDPVDRLGPGPRSRRVGESRSAAHGYRAARDLAASSASWTREDNPRRRLVDLRFASRVSWPGSQASPLLSDWMHGCEWSGCS